MVNRNSPQAARQTENFNSNNSLNVSERSPSQLPPRKLQSKDNSTSDDLIRSLSDAYENKRARQVFEWERARLQSVPITFL